MISNPLFFVLFFSLISVRGGANGLASSAPGPDHTLACQALTDSDLKQFAGSNEPPNFTPISVRSFRSREESGWETRRGRNLEIMSSSTPTDGPPMYGRAVYPAGFEAGSGPVMTKMDLPAGCKSIYVSFLVRLSDNWQPHPSGVNKVLHIWIAGRNKVYLTFQGRGGELRPQVNLQGLREVPVSRNLVPNASRRSRASVGTWHRWEILLQANSADNSDGRITWWFDGETVGRYDGIRFALMSSDQGWEQVSWNPTWGGRGGRIVVPQFMDVGQLYVSGNSQ